MSKQEKEAELQRIREEGKEQRAEDDARERKKNGKSR